MARDVRTLRDCRHRAIPSQCCWRKVWAALYLLARCENLPAHSEQAGRSHRVDAHNRRVVQDGVHAGGFRMSAAKPERLGFGRP
jgi:hypothetical protein